MRLMRDDSSNPHTRQSNIIGVFVERFTAWYHDFCGRDSWFGNAHPASRTIHLNQIDLIYLVWWRASPMDGLQIVAQTLWTMG